MKKDSIALIAAAVCLVGASFGAHTLDKTYVTDELVTSVTDPQQFVAVTNGTYADGKAVVTLETNAPDGSVFEIYASHPENGEISSVAAVKKGVAEATFDIPEGLSTNYITTYAVLDMSKQDENGAELPAVRYGENGEKMTGDMVLFTGQYNIGVSYTGYIPYPTEEDLKVVLNEEFQNFIYSITQEYGVIFDSVQPSAEGSWEEVNVIFTDYAVEETWDDFEKELKQGFFDLFSNMVYSYKMVDDDVIVKVNFKDTKGNILDKNY